MEQIMLNFFRGIKQCQMGATAVEYGLIASLLVIAMMAAFSNFANTTSGMWNSVSNKVVTASEG
jgi:pilus assembly protein Flp/PilA